MECASNQLTEIDLANNKVLLTLVCSDNKLNSIDISNNTELTILDCTNTQLTSLNVSNQLELNILLCGHNQLTSLDLSINSIGKWVDGYGPQYDCWLNIEGMPSLKEVCVWTKPFPPNNFKLCTDGSPNVYFTMDCNGDLP